MTRTSFLEILSAEERRIVQNWTCGVLAFYGSLMLVLVAVASLAHGPLDGAQFAAKAKAAPISAPSNKPNR